MFMGKPKSLKTELYRKLLHLSSLWIPILILWGNPKLNVLLFSSLLIVNISIEYATYQKRPFIRKLFYRFFLKTLRRQEIINSKFTPSGSIYVLASAACVAYFFSPVAGATAMTVMLVSDALAAMCGKTLGQHYFCEGKTFEGSLAFFLSAFIIIKFACSDISCLSVTSIALGATLLELFNKKIKLDDNFSVPVFVGYFLNLL